MCHASNKAVSEGDSGSEDRIERCCDGKRERTRDQVKERKWEREREGAE